MKKNNIVIISILSVVIICLIGGIIYLNEYYKKQLDYIFYTNVDETKDKEYDCSFTKTYRIVNLLDGYIAEVPEWSYVALDQFQNHSVIAARIPSTLKNKLQENKYYEFTYTVRGNGIIKTMEDVNTYLVLDDSNAEFKVTLKIKETDKQGLEQIQENICLPKTNGIKVEPSKPENHNSIAYNQYITRDEGRIVYLADNLDEFYVYDSGNNKQTLKEYANTWQTLDDIIKHITADLDLYGELNDGGTKIYKSKNEDTTIVVCHTVSGNQDIFIGDYNMQFDSISMCKR